MGVKVAAGRRRLFAAFGIRLLNAQQALGVQKALLDGQAIGAGALAGSGAAGAVGRLPGRVQFSEQLHGVFLHAVIFEIHGVAQHLADGHAVGAGQFADNDWKINYEILEVKVNGNFGIVLAKITYYDKNEKGEYYSFKYFLTLIFENINNKWKLIFDQNTTIK